jgi:hypothetical protein
MKFPEHRNRCTRTALALSLFAAAALVSALQAAAPSQSPSVLFIGNSFLFAACSPVRYYRTQTVTDLNGEGLGGVPALFECFAEEATLKFSVSMETIPGSGLDAHLERKRGLIVRPWNHVVMLGHSLLDLNRPGDPALLIRTTRELSELLHGQNPDVDIRLIATWARSDQVYPDTGHWHGKTVADMTLEVRAAYDRALANAPSIRGVIPVGQAFYRAMQEGVAYSNPYNGIPPGQVNLWAYDNHHASAFGYYLEALMVFGDLTGLDPRSLGKNERCAFELGFSREQTVSLQKVAFDQLSAEKRPDSLKPFAPIPLSGPPIAEQRAPAR